MIRSASCGGDHTILTTTDYDLVVFGLNSSFQCNVKRNASFEMTTMPEFVKEEEDLPQSTGKGAIFSASGSDFDDEEVEEDESNSVWTN